MAGHASQRGRHPCEVIDLPEFLSLLAPLLSENDMRRPAPFMLVAIGLAAFACKKDPAPPPTPVRGVNEDSIRAAAEQRRLDSIAAARRDSIARANAAAEEARRRAAAEAEALRARVEAARRTMLQSIPFDYDDATILAGARTTLDSKIAILQANPAMRIRISGHADERGSDEYNLALGQRRAEAAKAYLTRAGIAATRIETRSLGEERPAMTGSTEAAFAANRRDEFEIIAGGDNITVPR